MLIKSQLHTIFLLVGPSLAGKSTFAQALARQLKAANAELRATVLSTDAIRRELLGNESLERHDRAMTEVSEVAFEQLFSRMRALTKWPVSHEFIIVDSTGMNEKFRSDVLTLARDSAYRVSAVLFDFPHSHYFQVANAQQARMLSKQVKRFKSEVLPSVRKRDYADIIRLKGRNTDGWASLSTTIQDLPDWMRARINVEDKPVALIGDVHEAVDSARQLLDRLGDVRPVLVGDWMDKGGDTARAIELAEHVVARGGLLVIGNHESYLKSRLDGTLKDPAAPEIEQTYFSAIATLEKNPELTQRFLALAEQSLPYLHIRPDGQRGGVYATHAPVLQKFIGKHSSLARREQRNFRLPAKTSEDAREALAPIMAEASSNLPLHVWGHVPHAGPVLFRNHARIDTGAVQGGKLTALVVPPHRGRPYIVQADGIAKHESMIYDLEQPLNEPGMATDIDPEERRIIQKMLDQGIRYLSGTMPPAPATSTELEPIHTALEAMRKSGAREVILEPKYMGSRAQVYLFRGEPTRTFAVSRNGFVLKNPDLNAAWDATYRQFEPQAFWKETLILDGELMPWHAVGAGLITRDFRQYRDAVEAELSALANDEVFAEFEVGVRLDAHNRLNELSVYDQQLNIYGQPGDPHFMPFSVLAVDGESWVSKDQAEVFEMVSPDAPKLLLNLDDEDALAKAEAFFATLTAERQMEGVVIKPRAFEEGMIPYIKVRNEDYLTIIYGYDYKRRYATMCEKKKVHRKTAIARKEFALTTRLLTEKDPEAQVRLMAELRNEVEKEATLDPRL